MPNYNRLSATYRAQQETLARALQEQARRAGSGADLLTWTIRRRPQLKAGVFFDLPNHPYLVDIYRNRAQVKVIYKASQMGASEWAISYALQAADERKATILYVFPTDGHVSDFSAARIGPAIEASEYLGGIVVEGGAAGGKRGADRVTLKRVRDRFLYMRGAQVKKDGKAAQLKSIDADVVILDEVDEMDPRAPSIAEKRLGHSVIAEQVWISTPTYPGFGIHAKWGESDQREWFVPCLHCGDLQPLTIRQVVTEWDQLERPVAWHGQAEGRAFAACVRCGEELDRLAEGKWVAAYPERAIAGFHLTKLFSAQRNLLEIVLGLQTTDETKRREAFNQDLGEPYRPRGGQLTPETLDQCRREYLLGPDEHMRGAFMGIDVGRVLHCVIRSTPDPETGERRLLFMGEVESFERAGKLIRQYGVRRGVIDALPETRKARELQADFPGKLFLAYYASQRTGTKKASPIEWNKEEGVVNMDRTRTLDATFSRFYTQENTLPVNIQDLPEYYAHLQAPSRMIEDGPGGTRVAVYVESGPDHLAHAENYCMAASEGQGAPSAAVVESEADYHAERKRSAWQ